MSAVLAVRPLQVPWPGQDPFLFCMHHGDAYPFGNGLLGPAAPLVGRDLGQDFEGRDGWRMYHGLQVPGFPAHPHRGFETITIVRRGFCDHADSLGAAARFGEGDVQWITAGAGIVHSEMFPLLRSDTSNPLELFQIWLNLPRAEKGAPAHFAMLWREAVPRLRGDGVEVTVIAGALDGLSPPAPPPHSWASHPDAQVAIWTIRLGPGARWAVPPAGAAAHRALYVFKGSLEVAGRPIQAKAMVALQPDARSELASERGAEALLLQGRPIAEPVVQHGPFVTNSQAEIRQAFLDYQRTGFGGWPWPVDDPNHGPTEGRFARFGDGHVERPAPELTLAPHLRAP